ncbi:MAG: phosphoribosylformylglycinamidine cyclo-ligase [Fidelibacterota bacterium]
MTKIDYKSAGVDLDASDEAIRRIREKARTSFTPAVLADVGTFGALVDLKEVLKDYRQPVLVQSMDGVGTKMIVARMMGTYDTIGFDLLSATCNDIVVHGARPFTFLDYIANDRLNPEVIESIVSGIVSACREVGVALVGGETAEMPDTYLPGEHDLVGTVTGIAEKDRLIRGDTIRPGDVLLGFASSGLHTNGYSLARKLLFDAGKFHVDSRHPDLEGTVGEALLKPHVNYTKPVQALLDARLPVKGMAHITGGGLPGNILRILPLGCVAEIKKGSWPVMPLFALLQGLGRLDDRDMFRTFNMGIGLVMVVEPASAQQVVRVIQQFRTYHVYEIGTVIQGNHKVELV